MPLRAVLLLSIIMIGALAVDAAEFGGHYRKVVWREAGRQGQTLQHRAARLVDLGYSF